MQGRDRMRRADPAGPPGCAMTVRRRPRWRPLRRWRVSLRARMVLGAGLMAALALAAALMTAGAAIESAGRIERAIAAQGRMELLAALSRRIGDFALAAVESGGMPEPERLDRLSDRAGAVRAALDRVAAEIAASVEEARALDEETRMLRATQGLGLARMRAQFEQLYEGVIDEPDPEARRARLDGFATRFSPLLDQALRAERRDRDAAFARARDLRRGLLIEAGVVAAAAPVLLLLFHFGLTRPLLARIDRVARATADLARGNFAARLAVERHDELGLLFARMNALAARLARRRRAVEADRAHLNEIITARTADLSAANARLAAIDADRRRFFADVGHELRTPLTVILGETDLCLRAEALTEEEARQAMRVIATRARRLNRRIEDILRVARSEDGQIELGDAPFDLAEAARDAVADSAGPARRRRAVIEGPGPGPGPTAQGDRDWIRQVIAGLIDNAIRHGPEGGRIRLALVDRDGTAALTITDEGPGLTEGESERLFRRFARGAGAKPGEGFGVGLSLARWIVERHGGTITLTSPAPHPAGPDPAGPGTEAVLCLPRAGGAEETREEA